MAFDHFSALTGALNFPVLLNITLYSQGGDDKENSSCIQTNDKYTKKNVLKYVFL